MASMIAGLLLNYRDATRSIRCIHSLLDEGINRIVVWDNSDDGGVSAEAIIEAFRDFSDIQIHIADRNLGFAKGVNRGLECCARFGADVWVLLINNDARLLPGALDKFRATLASADNIRIVSSDINESGRLLGQGYYQRATGLMSWQPRRGYFPFSSGCCLLIAMDRIARPLFDEDFFMYGEDCELSWRLRRQSSSIMHLSSVLVEHEGRASSGLNSPFYEAHMVAAHLILARKLALNTLDAFVLHLARIPILLGRASVRAIRFRSLVPLSALWRGARIAFFKH